MMFWGSIVNVFAILVGGGAGIVLKNMKEDTKDTVTKGIGLGVLVLGTQMAMDTESFIIILISLSLGGMLGERLGIEKRMKHLGISLEKRFAYSGSLFAEGFVTATLLFVIGSMAIIGAIESGVSQNHSILYTKSVMDGFISTMLTASLGLGVLFSAIPVFIYQGLITLFSSIIVRYVPNDLMSILMSEISAIGGLMILGIGLNMLDITKIRVSNFLPGILILIVIISVRFYAQ